MHFRILNAYDVQDSCQFAFKHPLNMLKGEGDSTFFPLRVSKLFTIFSIRKNVFKTYIFKDLFIVTKYIYLLCRPFISSFANFCAERT